jgi:hypothetical protein
VLNRHVVTAGLRHFKISGNQTRNKRSAQLLVIKFVGKGEFHNPACCSVDCFQKGNFMRSLQVRIIMKNPLVHFVSSRKKFEAYANQCCYAIPSIITPWRAGMTRTAAVLRIRRISFFVYYSMFVYDLLWFFSYEVQLSWMGRIKYNSSSVETFFFFVYEQNWMCSAKFSIVRS